MIVFYELRGREYEEIGRVADGEIISGRDELSNVIHGPMLNDEDELLNVHDGPHVLAEKVEQTEKWLPYEDDDGERGWIKSDASEVRYTDDPPGEIAKGFEQQADGWTDTDTLEKAWIPYQGPHGGEGWQNVETGEVRYVEEPPGPVQGMGDEGDQSPQRWGSWDEDSPPGSPDDEDEEDVTDQRDEVTWENVQVGDEVAYYDKEGEMRQGPVTAVEQDDFGVVWVEQEDGGKEPVERDDFLGGTDELLGETLDAPDNVSAEWMNENLFVGQTLKLHNKRTDSVEYADIEEVFVAGGEINAVKVKIEQANGFGTRVTLTNDDIDWGPDDDNEVFEIREAEQWDTMSPEDQQEALDRHFSQNVRLTNMPAETRRKVSEQVTDEVFTSFGDMDVARRTAIGLFKIEDSVSRASCGGVGGYRIKVSERSPLDTLHHEFGHGVVSAYGYHYERVRDEDAYSDEKFKRRPTNLSHDFHDIKNSYGTIDFDFSEDSDFFEEEAYMLRLDEKKETFDPKKLEIGETYGTKERSFDPTITPTSIDRREDGLWRIEVEEYHPPVFMNDQGEMVTVEEEVVEIEDPHELDESVFGDDDFEIEGEQIELGLHQGESWQAEVVDAEGEGDVVHLQLSDGPYKHVWVDEEGNIETPDSDEWGKLHGRVEEDYGVTPDVDFSDTPPGYDEWKEEVENEVGGVEHPDLAERDFIPVEDREAADVFEDLQSGDAVLFSVPNRDPPAQPLVFKGENPDLSNDERIAYQFVKENGNSWSWSVDRETGELNTNHGSFIVGYDDTRSMEDSDEQRDVDHPLGHWDGFDPNPETAEDRIDNLVSAVNKAWYRQAKQFETSSDTFENMSYYIGSGYSATNAHETMAQAHQVMQDGDTLAVTNMMDNHPSLVAAYLDVFDVPENSATMIREHENADKYGIEP